MIKGFKEFITRGNVVDLAVGVVIGAAFGALVKSFTDSFISPLIKLVTGGGAVGGKWTVGEGAKAVAFAYGDFITAIITFLITAAAVYFLVVVPLNKLSERRKRGEETETEATPEERMVELLEQIASK